MEPRRIPITSLVTTKSTAKVNQYARLRRLHAKQGSTEVLLCRDEERDERVVLKAVKRNSNQDKVKAFKKKNVFSNDPPSSQQSIQREIAILKTCQHPCHVQLLEVIDDPAKETVYLALEYLSGGPVQWELNGEPTLTIDQSRRVIRDVIVGLEYLHYHGIIHRDIKPANLMWSEDRSYVKIIDYGISHFSETRLRVPQHALKDLEPIIKCASFRENDLQKVRGTGYFYPPEVVWYPTDPASYSSTDLESVTTSGTVNNVKPPITEAVDIWCLGVTAFCFFFGSFPFNPSGEGRHSPFALNKEILERDWAVSPNMGADQVPTGGEPSRQVEGHVMNMLDQMLQKDPVRRIELPDLKRHTWTLEGIADPEAWLCITAPSKNYTRPTWMRRSWSTLQSLFMPK